MTVDKGVAINTCQLRGWLYFYEEIAPTFELINFLFIASDTVLPAVLGFAVAGFIIATAFYVCRLRQRTTKKHEPAIYQPKKRTTAVRSPSGQMGHPPHYLKKSPSPTSVTKPLPGSLSPTADACLVPSNNLKTQSIITPPKYTEENEIQTKIIGQMENSTSSIGSDGTDSQEYGKLGSLVFKLRYLSERNALIVSVVRCRGLPYKNITDDLPNGTNGKTQTATDPYVKLQLLPDKQHKVKTRYVIEKCAIEICLLNTLSILLLYTVSFAIPGTQFMMKILHSMDSR